MKDLLFKDFFSFSNILLEKYLIIQKSWKKFTVSTEMLTSTHLSLHPWIYHIPGNISQWVVDISTIIPNTLAYAPLLEFKVYDFLHDSYFLSKIVMLKFTYVRKMHRSDVSISMSSNKYIDLCYPGVCHPQKVPSYSFPAHLDLHPLPRVNQF